MAPLYAAGCVQLILESAPIIGNICILKKAPAFYDHLYLTKEMKAMNIVLIVLLSVHFCDIMTVVFGGAAFTQWVLRSLWLFFRILVFLAISLVSTECIVRLICSEYGSYEEAKSVSSRNDGDGAVQYSGFRLGVYR